MNYVGSRIMNADEFRAPIPSVQTLWVRDTAVALKLLDAVRRSFLCGNSHYICNALARQVRYTTASVIETRAVRDLTLYIEASLEGEDTYYNWVMIKTPGFRDLSWDDSDRIARAGRVAWIEAMMEHISTKEQS